MTFGEDFKKNLTGDVGGSKSELKRTVIQLEKQLQDAQLRALKAEAEVERLRSRADRYKVEAHQLTEERDAAVAEVERLREDLHEAKNQIALRQAEVERLREMVRTKDDEIVTLKTHLALEHSDENTYARLRRIEEAARAMDGWYDETNHTHRALRAALEDSGG